MSKTPISVEMSLRRAQSNIRTGNLEQAETLFRDILKAFPGNKRALNGLNALRAQGSKAENNRPAGGPDITPVMAEGNSLFAAKRYLEAASRFQKALMVEPHFIAAYFNLSVSQRLLGSYTMAIKTLKKLVSIDPNIPEAKKNLADYLQITGRHDDAAKQYANILKRSPGAAGILCNYGVALKSSGHYDDAANALHRAAILEPAMTEAYNNLANILESFGGLNTALGAYRKALWLRPESGDIRRNLSKLKTYTPGDPEITQMERLKSADNIPEPEKVHFCFALGKAYEDIGVVESAFENYSEGNRLRKKLIGYESASDERLFNLIKGIAPTLANLSETDLRISQSRKRPVFIVGMPRSGTSLIEHILAGHSAVHGAGELPTLTDLVAPLIEAAKTNGTGVLTPQSIQDIRSNYLNRLDKLDTDKPVIVDKMPGNFRWIGFVLSAMPEAKIIHLKRAAMATCWSNFKHYFSAAGNSFAYDLRDLGHYFHLYEDLMTFWAAHYPQQVFDLEYESFTENPGPYMRALLDYCDLEEEDGMLDFQGNNRAVLTASSMQVRQKIYHGSSEAWRAYDKQLQLLKDSLGLNA